MVQSWDAFFSPTGGYMDNDFQIGWTGLGVDLGMSFAAGWLLDPLEKKEIARIRRRRMAKWKEGPHFIGGVRSSYSIPETRAAVVYDPKFAAQQEAFVPRGSRASEVRDVRSKLRASMGRFDDRIAKVRAKYSTLKTSAKVIGWGYFGLAAAQMVEAALKPGMSRAAIQSNVNMTSPSMDSNMAYTQRQRALMAIHESQIGIRNVLGNEASSFHR